MEQPRRGGNRTVRRYGLARRQGFLRSHCWQRAGREQNCSSNRGVALLTPLSQKGRELMLMRRLEKRVSERTHYHPGSKKVLPRIGVVPHASAFSALLLWLLLHTNSIIQHKPKQNRKANSSKQSEPTAPSCPASSAT